MRKNRVNEIEYEQNTGDYRVKKSNPIVTVIALVICVIVSACIWAYALNENDPILKKTVYLDYKYVGFAEDERLVPETTTVEIYGAKSKIENIEKIKVDVFKTEMKPNGKIEKKVSYPYGIKPTEKDDKVITISVAEKSVS